MRFGRGQGQAPDDGEGIMMAPLIDIVFLTLVFFMVTSVYATLESEVDIQLPTADSGKSDTRTRGEIFINLKDDGRIILNDREMTIDELQTVLLRVSEYFPGGAVIIRGDRLANLESAIAILDCCRKADIQNVSFAVVQPASEAA